MGCVVLSYYCNRGGIISVGRALDSEREVAGSIPGSGSILRVLK